MPSPRARLLLTELAPTTAALPAELPLLARALLPWPRVPGSAQPSAALVELVPARPCFLLLDAASSRPWSSPLAAPSCSFLVLAPAPATNAVEPVVFPVQFSRGFLLASALSQLRSAAPLVPCPWWCCGVATLCASRQPSWPQEQSTPYSSPSHDLALLLASPFIELIQHLPYPSHSPCLLEFPPWTVIVCARAQLRLITSVSFFDLVLASTWL